MSSISPVEAFLWSEPTYEWDEVVSLMRDARSTEAGKYEVTDDMYHTALDVLQIVSPVCVCVELLRPRWRLLLRWRAWCVLQDVPVGLSRPV